MEESRATALKEGLYSLGIWSEICRHVAYPFHQAGMPSVKPVGAPAASAAPALLGPNMPVRMARFRDTTASPKVSRMLEASCGWLPSVVGRGLFSSFRSVAPFGCILTGTNGR